jgi:RNA-directed DNA polymerase
MTEPLEGKMKGISSPEDISTQQQRIAEMARQAPKQVFWSLSKRLTVAWLEEAHRRTRRDGAAGIDGTTGKKYEENLEVNLSRLLDRVKTGHYSAPAVRRVYIPKGDGKEQRPIGIPTYEDKVLQRAVVMLLEPLYEEDFLDCSYGFRPHRSAHQALGALWGKQRAIEGRVLLELDIRKFFDTVEHKTLQTIVRQRVSDGVIVRLIGKWLNAGVMEKERTSYPESGTPQGGVISPLLANIYLHEVLDKWFRDEVQPRLRGRSFVVRYADDAVIGFEREDDAERVMKVLPKRFEKFGLKLHPEKTKLVSFGRPNWPVGEEPPEGSKMPETFDFLGFTHYWGRSRYGNWTVQRKTARDRFRRAVKKLEVWCKGARHLKPKEQHKKLSQKLRGHYQYYGITGNSKALQRFLYQAQLTWRKWLLRRGQRNAKGGWAWFNNLLMYYPLPAARVIEPV